MVTTNKEQKTIGIEWKKSTKLKLAVVIQSY
jgi:hypothetical protein